MGEEVPVAATIERLMAEGLSRHDAVHAVGSVLAAGIFDILKGGGKEDDFTAAYHEELRGLTAESWLQSGGDEELDYVDVDDELDDEWDDEIDDGLDEDFVADDEELVEEDQDYDHDCDDPHCGHEGVTVRRESPKVGRNDPCPCGSGKKYKKCCLSD
jgi:hypothetical protein